jgi:hypothetical protein
MRLKFSLLLQLSDVIDEMDDDWGSLACPSSDSHSFWKHEWTKHGTCSGLGQHGYFQSAVDLYGKYDITAALADHGNCSLRIIAFSHCGLTRGGSVHGFGACS